MDEAHLTTLLRLVLALAAGALIGLERTYHGRPAGFRTHTLVCTASSLLMLLTVYQWELLSAAPLETIRVDPTRMGQGIMTGIGFLGAGAIMKDKLTVRGLTTAASIWITAAIGIIIGMGFYFAAAVTVALTLGTLSLFRWFEAISPTLNYARLTVRFLGDAAQSVEELHQMLAQHAITGASLSYRMDKPGGSVQYQLTIRSRNDASFAQLATQLRSMKSVAAFSIRPAGV